MIFAPRLVLGTLWLVFLIVGECCLYRHPPKETDEKPRPPAFSAKHALPENYRIGRADLDWSSDSGKSLSQQDFLGKYIKKEIAAGAGVTVDNLLPQPAIKPAADREATPLPLASQPELTEALNAGSRVNVFEEKRLVLKQVPILALHCAPASGSNCTAIMDLDRNEAYIYAHTSPDKLRIVLGKP
jgi:hypothetical protein